MTWAVRAIAFVFAVSGLAWIIHAVRDRFDRTVREFDGLFDIDVREPDDGGPGAGLLCLWCHPTPAGRAGRCGCTSKCPDVDHCIGDYTSLGSPEFAAQLEAMLRGDGHE